MSDIKDLLYSALLGVVIVGEVENLLKEGADPDTVLNDGGTSLMVAADLGYPDVVDLLVGHGADVNRQDDKGWTPLTYAAARGRADIIVRLLDAGADAYRADKKGWTPLVHAAQGGHLEVVAALLDHSYPGVSDADGGQPPNLKGQWRQRHDLAAALHAASREGHTDIVAALLGRGVSANALSSEGYSPLYTAVAYNKVGVAQVLLEHGADVRFAKKNGRPILEVAQEIGDLAMLVVLLSHAPAGTQDPGGQASETGLDSLLAELDSFVGLARVKEDVTRHVLFLRVQQLRKEQGLVAPEQSLHMVFTGNPGTGKTTVARLLGRIYRAMGFLSKGHLVETDRGGLVAGFQGQTALKVREVVEQALGGVLFIDEAYGLTPEDGTADAGQEAVDTLVKLMEDHRDDLIVIVAGYTERMAQFLRSNPGLESRFNKRLHFDDYTPAELADIFKAMAEQQDYLLDEDAETVLVKGFQAAWQRKDETFGNARLARNWLETAVSNHAHRVGGLAGAAHEELTTLTASDIPTPANVRSSRSSGENEPGVEELLAELDALVGMEPVKEDVRQVVDATRLRKLREAQGLPVSDQSLHLVFTGNPGTGKTSVARLVGRLYKALGLLSRGQFVETDRAGLVAEWMGQTAPKVRRVVQGALGGVLFIDEAYALTKGRQDRDEFGAEAVDTLLKLMEDYRDDLVVIVAGYTGEMETFLQSNPGLASRFRKRIRFPDYTPEELNRILRAFAAAAEYEITEAAAEKSLRLFREQYEARDASFGNARLARNLFESAVNRLASRVARSFPSGTAVQREDLVQILPDDLPETL